MKKIILLIIGLVLMSVSSLAYSCDGVDESDPCVCTGHGDCVAEDVCECDDGYNGDYCNIASTVLEKYFCGQYLFTDIDACSDNNGYCSYGGGCVCIEGFEGEFCETVINNEHQCFGKYASDPAACNGGVCTDTDTCTCPAGFTGDGCTEPVDCSGNPCYYGTCVGDNTCKCNPGFTGPNCIDPLFCYGKAGYESSICNGQGDCVATDTCVCNEYFYGPECQTEYECFGTGSSVIGVCSGQGKCVADDVCECDYGWGAQDCHYDLKECGGYLATSSDVCNGLGVCKDDGTNTWKCFCNDGYTGDSCDRFAECGNQNGDEACNGAHGTCVKDNVCECNFPYTGELCQDIVQCEGVLATDYENVCSGFGQCMKNGACVCDDEHTGADCSQKIQCGGKYYDDPEVCGGQQLCTKSGCAPDPNWTPPVTDDVTCDPSDYDLDGDGYTDDDCDDDNADINPDADEICDGVDNDCDGSVDNDDFTEYTGTDEGRCQQGITECVDGSMVITQEEIRPRRFEIPGNKHDEDCDGEVLCDSKASWRNHGQFVRCVVKEARNLFKAGDITKKQRNKIIRKAAKSNIGKKIKNR